MNEGDNAGHVEWELLAKPLDLDLQERGPLWAGAKRARVSRTADFELEIQIDGSPSDDLGSEQSLRLGEVLPPPETITAVARGLSGEIHGYAGRGIGIRGGGDAREIGSAQEIFVEVGGDEPDLRIEWLLNVPVTWIWPDTTTRVTMTTLERRRGAEDPDHIRVETGLEGRARDHVGVQVEYRDARYPIRVGLAQKTSPNVPASGGFLECKADVPDEIVDSVLACLSFSLGRPIASLGSTTLGRDAAIQRATARTLSLPGGPLHLGRAPLPPATVAVTGTTNLLEAETLENLLARLVGAYEPMQLRRIFWLYWNTTVASLDMQGVGYGAVLEALRRAHVAARGDKSDQPLLEETPWTPLHAELKAVVEKHAAGAAESQRPVYETLMRKLGNLNSRPLDFKLVSFFEGIGLDTSEVERLALSERNPSSHGARRSHGWEISYLRLRALRTLVNRAILACVGFEGDYVDYSTYDFPSRPLASLLGGPNGDGVSA